MSEAIIGELSDLLWERVLALDPLTAQRAGRQVDALPRGGPEAMEQDVSFAVSTLGRLAGIGGVDAAFLRDHLEQEAAEAQRFWYRFPVTPYNALPLSLYREEIFAAAEIATAADADRYLSLLDDYAALAEQIGGTMQAQRERGIRLPAWAVPEAMATMRGHADAAASLLVTADRCAALPPGPAGRLADGAETIVTGRLAAAFRRVLDDLATDERAGGLLPRPGRHGRRLLPLQHLEPPGPAAAAGRQLDVSRGPARTPPADEPAGREHRAAPDPARARHAAAVRADRVPGGLGGVRGRPV